MNIFKMAKLNFTILFVMAVLLSSYNTVTTDPRCEDLKVQHEIVEQRNNLYSVEISTENAEGKINYLFYNEKGSLMSQQYESKKVKDLKAGTYFYTVIVAGGCKVTNKIEVK